MKASIILISIVLLTMANGKEYHVAKTGDDGNEGTAEKPLLTVQAAAELAQPGDVITVHTGIYRERVNPPRGGTSDEQRITYRAFPGDEVVLTGSEIIKGWVNESGDVWKVSIPNTFFGEFNPYSDEIHGDWFNDKGRKHHTGAVYLNGDWLLEAAARGDVGGAAGASGGQGVGFFGDAAGDAVRFNNVVSGSSITIRYSNAGSTTQASLYVNGTDVATVTFAGTGGWYTYQTLTVNTSISSSVELKVDGDDFAANGTYCCNVDFITISGTNYEAEDAVLTACTVYDDIQTGSGDLWFAEVTGDSTFIWAQFRGTDPNAQLVEINVRQTVFYPEETRRNYITVSGFIMRHAATPWAPPTAEQIGLIGTNWSRGWIIENNRVSHSKCVGITLGKYGDQWDNTSQNSAEGYVETINRALQNGWHKDSIGSHLVRKNTVFSCEQAGIVGSLGAVFSTITGNTIHDIHVHQLFTGAEMAGIKIHASIDMEISDNHIYRTIRGIWLDWMAQGARVTRNLIHDSFGQDLFMEVNHGPAVIDNNLFLTSSNSFLLWSTGNAYVHNLIAGRVSLSYQNRETPYHFAHSTEVAGLHDNPRGDTRYYNNIHLVNSHLDVYNTTELPVYMGGNVFLNGARACTHETDPLLLPNHDPGLQLTEEQDGTYLELSLDEAWRTAKNRDIITSATLGRASIPDLPYEDPEGNPIRFDTDYFGNARDENNPFPGPFEQVPSGKQRIYDVPPGPVPVSEPLLNNKNELCIQVRCHNSLSKTILSISAPSLTGEARLSIHDLNGKRVLQEDLSFKNAPEEVALDEKHQGIYFVVLSTEDRVLVRKVFIRKNANRIE